MTSDEWMSESDTGGRKGQKLARYDLIDPGVMDAIARQFGRGAYKYTKYGDCTCARVESRSDAGACAPVATTSSSRQTTQSSQNASEKTPGSGESETRYENSTSGDPRTPRPGSQANTESRRTSTETTWGSPAEYVERNPSTLTTTTDAAKPDARNAFVGGSATDATSASDTWRGGTKNTGRQHDAGCPALEVVESGDGNYRKGYPWSLSYAAAQRHLNAYWGGEDWDRDPFWDEHNLGNPHHLDSAIFHLMALREFFNTQPGYDDRPKATKSPTPGIGGEPIGFAAKIKQAKNARPLSDVQASRWEVP